jgi:hypothetical protein
MSEDIEYWSTWHSRTMLAIAIKNWGRSYVIEELFQHFGIPIPLTTHAYLNQKEREHKKRKEREQSEEGIKTRKQQKQRMEERKEKEKAQKKVLYKKHRQLQQ